MSPSPAASTQVDQAVRRGSLSGPLGCTCRSMPRADGAARQRQRDRARLERYVEAGLNLDDAESLIKFEYLSD